LYLNYDEDNYEDVDANYVFSIHKYSSYEKYKLKGRFLFKKLINYWMLFIFNIYLKYNTEIQFLIG